MTLVKRNDIVAHHHYPAQISLTPPLPETPFPYPTNVITAAHISVSLLLNIIAAHLASSVSEYKTVFLFFINRPLVVIPLFLSLLFLLSNQTFTQ